MRTITGKICGLLSNSAGEINGIVLDNGQNIEFPPELASRVLSIATLGSRVEVRTLLPESPIIRLQFTGVLITEMASKQSVSLSAFTSSYQPPEASAEIYPPPGTATPLAPAFPRAVASSTPESWHDLATRNEVANEMEHAYEGLHRTQAMLAYLKMVRQEKTEIGEYLDEAKHTYVQALTCYQARDFDGAREFAAASGDLSRMVEILISRTFHLSSESPKLVPMPPEHVSDRSDLGATSRELDRIQQLLARIDWVLANGTLPSEDREQVQKLSVWGANLRRWALRLLDAGAPTEALEFVRAADAAVNSAEHLCRKCYLTRAADSRAAAFH
jgi:hypothetical protein